jgi:hypothetical protein
MSPPAVLIHRRPSIVEARTRIGDWEGDLIVGRHSRSAIGTLVDRTSRAVRLFHLPCGHSAEAFTAAFADVLGALPEAARRTLTWDQGSEMARHDVLAEHFEEGVFFADPGSPWQRGTNENTNGFLRQFFPKGKDLSVYTVEDQTGRQASQQPPVQDPELAYTRPCLYPRDMLIRSVCCEDRTNSPYKLTRRKGVNFQPPTGPSMRTWWPVLIRRSSSPSSGKRSIEPATSFASMRSTPMLHHRSLSNLERPAGSASVAGTVCDRDTCRRFQAQH